MCCEYTQPKEKKERGTADAERASSDTHCTIEDKNANKSKIWI